MSTRDDLEFGAICAAGLLVVASGAYLAVGHWKASAVSGWAAAALVFGFGWSDSRAAERET